MKGSSTTITGRKEKKYELHCTIKSYSHIMSYQYLLTPFKNTVVSKPSFESHQCSCWLKSHAIPTWVDWDSCQLIRLERKNKSTPCNMCLTKIGNFLAPPKKCPKKKSYSPQDPMFSQREHRHFNIKHTQCVLSTKQDIQKET